ncbi:MAG: HAMP domain-containing sensor histidine kinase, partial [Pseudomonadota bacterium]
DLLTQSKSMSPASCGHWCSIKQLDALKRAIDSYAPTLLALPSESRKLQIRLAQVRTRSFVIDATANLHGLPDKPVAFFKRGIRAIQELGDGDTAIPALRLAELDASARASALRNDAKAITDRVQEHLAVLTERANSQLNDHVASSDNIKWQLVYLVCALAVVSLGSVVWFQVRFLDDRLMRPLNTLTDQIESFKQHGTIQPLPALPTNEIQQVAETFHAVAKQKRAHEARLDEQNDDLNRLNARLAETNREQSEFSYAVSHDLKSPINTLRMLLGELQHVDQAVEPETHERFLAQAVSTLSRMTRLIDSVLQYASMVENRHAQERVNLDQVLGEVLTDLEADIRDAGASIDCDRLGNLNGSPFQLRMLLQNLIGNAIKFRRAGTAPVITVHRVASSPNHLNLEIADNGIGIPVEHQEKVFSLFHRLHNTSDYAGSGLGLALCKRIVSNHNGRIQIGSVTPHGTVFHIALPTQLPVWQAA